jgi:hypothetical protein
VKRQIAETRGMRFEMGSNIGSLDGLARAQIEI